VQAGLSELEDRLWDAADELRANSGLKASEYAAPVLGLIFLRFADVRFEAARERIEAKATSRRKIEPGDYQAEGLVYLAPEARFGALLDLPEGRTSARPSTMRCG
jgi:type I restriction enzyme M protein